MEEIRSKDKSLTNRYLEHFKDFVERHDLFDKTQDIFLGVSGGLDSVYLSYLVSILKRFGYSNRLCLININHNTRIGQKAEAKLVENLASLIGAKFIGKSMELKSSSNFEAQARSKRYEIFEKYRTKDSVLLLGHHINDSFEWSLMQSFKSSNPKANIGIPLINGWVRRPLMCFTREQLERLDKNLSLEFMEDPTNSDQNYERNYIRHTLYPLIKKKNPSCLKHYARRQNALALELGIHVNKANIDKTTIIKNPNWVRLFNFDQKNLLENLYNNILLGLKHLNPDGRGSINHQVEKIKRALENNKYGPFKLSNTTYVYLDLSCVLISKSNLEKDKIVEIDNNYSQLSISNFKNCIEKIYKSENPVCNILVAVDTNIKLPYDARVHPTSHSVALECKKAKIKYISALKLMKFWSKKNYGQKKLKICFLDAQ